jgi:hypothetical protein
VVESDLHYRLAGRSLHEHEYLRIRSEVARVFPPGHLQSPVPPLASMRPWFSVSMIGWLAL